MKSFSLSLVIAVAGGMTQNSVTFEVASVRPSNRQDGAFSFSISGTPNGFTATNVPLEKIIAYAYNEPGSNILGGPDWIKSDLYDVLAKAEGTAPNGQIRLMLQALLADRFQLKVRRETRELAALAVVIGKNGPKLTKTKSDEQPLIENDRPGRLSAKNQSIASLLAFIRPYLSGPSRTPVLDQTGLSEKFDFTLEWSIDANVTAGPDNAVTTSPELPSIFTALEEQLGLKVQSTRAPLPVLVIESVQRPSAN